MRHPLANPSPSTPMMRLGAMVAILCVMFGQVPFTNAQTATPTPGPSETIEAIGSDFYGINFIDPRQPWLRIGYESGARFVRWQFNWRDHEIDPSVWDWTKSDPAIRAWTQAGLKVDAILHNPPPFARVNPDELVPTNLDIPYYNPQPGFARFCYTFASRYKGQIASYEVWNEPDLGEFWQGTAAQYAALLKGCYLGIKAADPDATVVMAGMVHLKHEFFSGVLRQITRDSQARSNNYYFDAVAVHMYGDPELVYSHTVNTRDVMTKFGITGKPLWITETNVALRKADSSPYPGLATQEEVGWYILQAASNAYAAEAAKLMFFRLSDADMGEVWGLVNNDGTPRPAYRSLQLAATVLRDITEAKREVRDGAVITTMRRADSARIITLFSETGETIEATVPAETSAAVLINSAGGYATIEPDDQNLYHVTLPPAHGRDMNRLQEYSVGGPVMIIIELDRTPPTTSVEVLPLPFDEAHVMVRWRGNDGRFGTGVVKYDVEVSINSGSWESLQTETTEVETIYDISSGGTFAFRARATDRIGNIGEFSEPVSTSLQLAGTLVARIIDLRGQGVPSARIELANGSLYDADATGLARIDLPPGIVEFAGVDGSIQGQATPSPVEIVLNEETTVTWMLMPQQKLIEDGGFENGLGGWAGISPGDIQQVTSDDPQHPTVLRLNGQRYPWGSPAASLSLDVPAGFDAGVLSFYYRLPGDGQVLRLRVITGEQQQSLWQMNTMSEGFARIWVDMSAYAGQKIDLRFELWGAKDSPPSAAEIDDIVFGNVPVVP